MIQNWVQFNESSMSPSDRIKNITLDDIKSVVKSARSMNYYLHSNTYNYPLANRLYVSFQFLTGMGAYPMMEDFL